VIEILPTNAIRRRPPLMIGRRFVDELFSYLQSFGFVASLISDGRTKARERKLSVNEAEKPPPSESETANDGNLPVGPAAKTDERSGGATTESEPR
jgi:hypothetical protein